VDTGDKIEVPPVYEWDRYPVVIVRAGAYELTDEQFTQAVNDFIDEIQKREGFYGLVVDTLGAHSCPPSQRRILADLTKPYEHMVKKRSPAMGMVIGNGLVRGMMTAVFWIYKPPTEIKVFSEAEEAVAWAAEKVRIAERDRVVEG
jgi:hypothetical protein